MVGDKGSCELCECVKLDVTVCNMQLVVHRFMSVLYAVNSKDQMFCCLHQKSVKMRILKSEHTKKLTSTDHTSNVLSQNTIR